MDFKQAMMDLNLEAEKLLSRVNVLPDERVRRRFTNRFKLHLSNAAEALTTLEQLTADLSKLERNLKEQSELKEKSNVKKK